MTGLPTFLKFLGVGLLWGSSFMWSSRALHDLTWEFLTWVRPLIGLLTLTIFLAVRNPVKSWSTLFPKQSRVWLNFLLIGFLFTALPSTL